MVVKWAFLLTVGLLLYRHERRLRLYLLLGVRRLERIAKRLQSKIAAIRLRQREPSL